MEHISIAPGSVKGDEPTCLAAFLVMAHRAALDVSPELARQLLSRAGVAWQAPAAERVEGLDRVLSYLKYTQVSHGH